jgi:hypothetical protein
VGSVCCHLTVPEIRRLLMALIQDRHRHRRAFVLAWR